jgi:DHA3 family macrolide efflux protein-like MFS transporter
MSSGVVMLIGGLAIGTWGGPKRHFIWGVIAAIALSGFGYSITGLRPLTLLVGTAQFVILIFIPLPAALSQAVWQTKVSPDIQGRVFAIRSMIAYLIIPLANLVAGPLADNVFEPIMEKGGILSSTIIARIVGVGSGRGIAMIFIISAFSLWLSSFYAFSHPRIRNLEDEIPDAIPDEPVEEVCGELEEKPEPVMQT